MRQHRSLKLTGLLCAFAIVVVSLVPEHLRPHSGAPKGWEHFSAYAMSAAVMALGFPRQLLFIAALFVVGSGILEVGQTWVAARTPSISDFGFSSFGAFAGLLMGLCADRLFRSKSSSRGSHR